MKKLIGLSFTILMAAILFTACLDVMPPSAADESRKEAAESKSEVKREEAESKAEEKNEEAKQSMLMSTAEIDALLANLKKDEYPQLAITAEIKEDKAILPGSAVKVDITLKNNGDKTLGYAQGPNVFETPQALFMRVEELQPVIPKDQLGVPVTDTLVKELKPGEEKKFGLHLMAVKPDDQFAVRTHEVFDSENKYIVDMQWDALHMKYPDLEKAAVGEYHGAVYFTYHILEEGQKAEDTMQATGYAEAAFSLKVAE